MFILRLGELTVDSCLRVKSQLLVDGRSAGDFHVDRALLNACFNARGAYMQRLKKQRELEQKNREEDERLAAIKLRYEEEEMQKKKLLEVSVIYNLTGTTLIKFSIMIKYAGCCFLLTAFVQVEEKEKAAAADREKLAKQEERAQHLLEEYQKAVAVVSLQKEKVEKSKENLAKAIEKA